MKTLIKAAGLSVFAGILCLNFLIPACAKYTGSARADTMLTGSITVTMRSGEDEAIPGGSLTLYKVGTYIWINTRYLIQLEDEFTENYTSLYLEIESLDTAIAQEFLDRADKNNIEGETHKIAEDGKVSFDNLKEGLYLIAQKEAPQGYYPVNPFFVTIPFFDYAQGIYIYDVDASPKTGKYIPVVSLIPLEPAYHDMAELTPAWHDMAELFPAWHDMAQLIPATPSDAVPSYTFPSDASSSEPAPANPGAGGSSSGQQSRPASHRSGTDMASAESVLPDIPETNTLEIDGDTANIDPLPPTGEGRKILAGAALCLLSGIALAAAVLKRVKGGGR